MVPSTEECKRLAADLRLFLLAVMLRKMERNPGATIPPGSTCSTWEGRASTASATSAPSAPRLAASKAACRAAGVEDQLEKLDALQLFALARLAEYTAQYTYTRSA